MSTGVYFGTTLSLHTISTSIDIVITESVASRYHDTPCAFAAQFCGVGYSMAAAMFVRPCQDQKISVDCHEVITKTCGP